ncbi:MAG TPA: ribonuclease D [Oculatellaceae cyanobacterium]
MTLINRQGEIDEICAEIDKGGRCAIDLEFIPERTYAPILCLVQVSTDFGAHVIDPLAQVNLQPLWSRIADPNILVVLHAANQDLDIINSLSGKIPQNIFDTQIAAGFAGFGYPVGYGKLLNQLLGISIDKTESFTDWMTRPLTESQMTYAIDDVKHLLPIYDQLCKQQEQSGRLSWAREECKRYSDPARYEKDRSLDFLRIKGASALNRKTLAVLQALCDWRTDEAIRTNKPTKSILSDNTMLELARRPCRQFDDIKRVRSMRPEQVRNFGPGIIKATEKGLRTPEHLLPTWPSSRMPPKKDVLIADMLFALLKVFAYQAELATELVGTRDDVQAFVRAFREGKKNESSVPLIHGWRWDLAGTNLWQVLEATPVTIVCDDSQEPPVKIHLSGK